MFEQFATVARALGHPYRLMVLQLLGQGETAVEALAGRAGITVANASQHLQRLRRAGLVVSRKQGQKVLYRLADDAVLGLVAALREIAERNLAEAREVIQSYFRERDGLEPLSRKELLRRIHRKQVTVLDVRSAEEFASGHLPDAINIPLKELRRRLKELPRSQQVVAYCRGPYCVFSYEAVAELRKHGYQAWRLEDGYPEWKAAGLPVKASLGFDTDDRR
ncbi:MAG: metalloregulator ArsR/SmtB family transcription factor [Candidatus Binatus sp.]|uniref:ArsR/SmtB family transcription factor n=1 Tax=Candidatus Binatus sp. TaxID=2811406 RepID=UPI003C766759